MARDFRANQLRTFQIIGSGSTAAAGTQQENVKIQMYPSTFASDYAGNHSLDLSKVGKDVWMYVAGDLSGSHETAPLQDWGNRSAGSTVLFTGNVVVSGTLFAERSIVQVDETMVGDLLIPNNLYVTGGAIINTDSGNYDFIVNSNGFAKAFWVDADVGVIINDSGRPEVDFRVESDTEPKALFIDSSANTLYINEGKSAFTTVIGSDNDEVIRVDATGVVFNEEGHATNDFRIESDTETHALFVDAGANELHINSGETAFLTTIHNIDGEAVSVTAAGVVINDDSHADIDFRVESDNNTEAILLNAGSNSLHINRGEGTPTAFTTHIASVNAEAFTVGAAGVIINSDGHAANDFRVATDNVAQAIFVDAGDESIDFNAAQAAADAIRIQASNAAGGVDLDAGTGGIAIDTTGALSLGSTYNNASAIDITTNSGTSERILIKNTQGQGTGAVELEATAGGITLDAALDILLDADGGQIEFKDNGADHFLFDCDNTKFVIYDDDDSGDLFQIQVAANGASTISTVDAVGASADLSLLIDGDITLDADGGQIYFKDANASHFLFDCDNTKLVIYDDDDSADFFTIQVAANGATTIASVDGVGAAANLQITADGTAELAGTDVTLDASGDITLSADGDNVKFDNGTNTTFDFSVVDSPVLKMQPAGSTVDYFSITTTTNGATTIATVDDGGGTSANLSVNIDGNATYDHVGQVSFDSSTSTINIGTAGVAQKITVGGDTSTRTEVELNAVLLDLNAGSGGVSVHGAAASSFSVTTGDLSLVAGSGQPVRAGRIILSGSSGVDSVLVQSDITISGDLKVDGTTTTVNSTTVTVDDPVFTLGGDSAPGSDDGKDRGIEFRYNDGSARVGFMGWDNDLGGFALYHHATNTSEVFSGTKSNLTVGKLLIDGTADHIAVVASNLKVTAAADIDLIPGGGDVNLAANIGLTFGGSTNKIEADGSNNLEMRAYGNITLDAGGDIILDAAGNEVFLKDSNVTWLHMVHDVELGSVISAPGNLAFDVTGSTVTFHESGATALEVHMTGSTSTTLRTSGSLNFNCDGANISLQNATGSVGSFGMLGQNLYVSASVSNKDMIFMVNDGGTMTEVMRLDGDVSSLLMAGTKKIEFTDANAYIHHDGTDLKLADDADINLVAGVDILLDAAGDIHLDTGGDEIKLKAGGTEYARLTQSSNDLKIQAVQSQKDVAFARSVADGSAEIARFDSSATSLLMATTNKIEFYDAGVFVHASADGKLALSADAASADAVVLNASHASGGIDLNITGSNVLSLGDSKAHIKVTTEAESLSTGALVVDGGVGIAKDLYVGDDLALKSDSAVLSLGDGNDVTLTHDGTTGATLTATTQIDINVGASSRWTASDGDLSIIADGADNKVTIKGDHTSGVAVHIDANQAAGSIVDIDAGALDIDASAGISMDAAAASNLVTTAGDLTITAGTAQPVSAGRVILSGSSGTDSVLIQSDATVSGDLTVAGAFAPDQLSLASDGYIYFGDNTHYVLRDGSQLKFLDATVGVVKTLSDLAERNVSTTAWTIVDGPGARMKTTSSVSFDYDGNYATDMGTDLVLWVSGAIGGHGVTGSAAFGGDLVVSGNMLIGAFDDDPNYVIRVSQTAQKLVVSGTTVWGETPTTAPDGALKLVIGENANVHNATFTNLVADKDIIFAINDSDGGGADTEVLRLKGSTTSIRIPAASKMEFGGVSRYIKSDNTSLIELINSNNSGGVTITAGTTANPGNITLLGHVIPSSDNAFDMGSEAKRWANVYTGDLHLKNEKGNWTIVEDADKLIVINNLTGKRFKMMLEPLEEEE